MTPAARVPAEAEYVPAPVFREPVGTLGAPNQDHARLELDLSRPWSRFPIDMRTVSWRDLFGSRRRDVLIVYQATIGYTQAEHASRRKWLCSKIGRIQIPVELASDRSFLLEHRDALYLERMHDYLDDRRARPLILDQEFWLLDLPLEDTQRARDRLSQIRAEWALCVGSRRSSRLQIIWHCTITRTGEHVPRMTFAESRRATSAQGSWATLLGMSCPSRWNRGFACVVSP